MTRLLLTLLLILPLFTATSCLEGEEEIWINLDASGHLAARYEIPAIAMGQIGDPEKIIHALNLIAAKEEGITITRCTAEPKGNKVIFRLEAGFDDVLDLLEVAQRNEDLFVEETATDPEKIAAVAGHIDFRFIGLRPAFDREIHPTRIFPAVVTKRPGMLGPSTFKYTIHLPAKVKTTNAHTISNDRKTVSWSFLLKDHFEKPMTMSLTTEFPIPWWGWFVIAALLFLIAFLTWRLLKWRHSRARHRRPTHQVDFPTA